MCFFLFLILSTNSCFLVTVQGLAADKAFTVLAHLPVKAEEFKQYKDLMMQHIEHKDDVEITHLLTDTPKKRLQTLQSAVPEASTPPPFDKRQKLTDAQGAVKGSVSRVQQRP